MGFPPGVVRGGVDRLGVTVSSRHTTAIRYLEEGHARGKVVITVE